MRGFTDIQKTIEVVHDMFIATSQHAGGKVRSFPPPPLTYYLNGCKAKGSLGPIWDHLKLLYIERLTASSFLFFCKEGESRYTET